MFFQVYRLDWIGTDSVGGGVIRMVRRPWESCSQRTTIRPKYKYPPGDQSN